MIRRAILMLGFALILTRNVPAQSSPALHQVRKIHVAAMGSDAEAERFHALFQDELRGAGFDIADTSSAADAILTGEFSTEAQGDYSSARATLRLKSPDSKRTLWSGDYISQHKGTTREDVVLSLAKTCAERLHKDWQKN